ncbi:MAG: MGMT family protein [Pseudomonadota bacterium]
MDRAERHAAILSAVSRIPRGRVSSYGVVAKVAGLPRGAREVGRVLSQLPSGTAVPWHRVLNAQGRIHNAASSDAGQRQIARLRDEGIRVERGRVSMREYGWQVSLDEWLWSDPAQWLGDTSEDSD